MKIKIEYNQNKECTFAPMCCKLDLREAAKIAVGDIYFKPNDFAKNLGCYVFGQKDRWKSILRFNDIKGNKFVIEFDNRLFDRYKKDSEKLILKAIEYMKNQGWVESYEILQK